MTNTKKRYP